MTTRTDKPKPVPGFVPPMNLDWLSGLNYNTMEAFTKASQAYAEGMVAVNGEVFRFMTERLRYDADMGQSLAKCQDLSNVAALQQDWARKTVEDYMAESARLMEMASTATMKGWQTPYPAAEKAVKATEKAA